MYIPRNKLTGRVLISFVLVWYWSSLFIFLRVALQNIIYTPVEITVNQAVNNAGLLLISTIGIELE